MRRTLLALAALPLLLTVPTRAEDPPSPGRSTHHHGGLRYEMLVPTTEQAKGGYSLLVLLHGNRGKAVNMVASGRPLLELGFVTVAP